MDTSGYEGAGRRIRLLVLALIAITLFAVPLVQADPKEFAKYAWVKSPQVNLRAGPESKHGIVATLTRGMRVEVTEKSDRWVHVIPPPYDIRTFPGDLKRRPAPTFNAGWLVDDALSSEEIVDEATAHRIFVDWTTELLKDPQLQKGSFAGIRLVPLSTLWSANDTLEHVLGVGFDGEAEITVISAFARWIFAGLGSRAFALFDEAESIELRFVARVWAVDTTGTLGDRYETLVRIRMSQLHARRTNWEEVQSQPLIESRIFTEFWERENALLSTR